MNEKEAWGKAYERIFELYGDMPDLRIVSRFLREKQAFMQYGVGKYFSDLAVLRREAENEGKRFIVKAAVGACLSAYLLGAVDENPLPAHHYCPVCRAVEWLNGSFALDAKKRTCACGAEMKPDGFDIPFEAYIPYAKKNKCVDFAVAPIGRVSDLDPSHFQESFVSCSEACKRLERATGVRVEEIDLNDREIRRRVLSAKIGEPASAGGETLIKRLIVTQKPENYNDLLKLIGLLHGTRVWKNNAEQLISDGVCKLSDIPSTRDEVFKLIGDAMNDCGISDNGFALDVSEKARSGYYSKHGIDGYTKQTLSMLGLDDWLSGYLSTIRYMSVKALAVLELKYLIIFCWYEANYPSEYRMIMRSMTEFD